MFVQLERVNRSNHEGLRALYEMVGDVEAVAALGRKNMGQGPTVETTR